MGWLQIAKFVGIGLVIAGVIAVAISYRHELIEKGKNIVYAEDNAARVKAQEAQTALDARLIKDQKEYIDHIESRGEVVKEKIRYVQAPCAKDGADDPRLGDVIDWLRRPKGDNGQANGGLPSQGEVPPPRLPARAQ